MGHCILILGVASIGSGLDARVLVPGADAEGAFALLNLYGLCFFCVCTVGWPPCFIANVSLALVPEWARGSGFFSVALRDRQLKF